MAIKVSNQITFTEQKKILKIQEWYLATNYRDDVETSNGSWGTWSKEIQTIDASKPYLWNYEEVIYSLGDPEISDPMLIGVYSKSDGRGIERIINEYLLTQVPELPETPQWSRDSTYATGLTPELKYLWNREIIVYTDGEEQTTDPAIIGVYGDSGAEALDFQIYSVDGFEFSDSVTSITLQTVAITDGSIIEEGATYQWKWWNSSSASDDKYEAIPNATSSSLVVNVTDLYALAGLKCEMTYDEIVYADYVSLTEKTIIYTPVVKFFNGSNIFTANDLYLVAYIDLYKNNEIIESALDYATTYCTGVATVSSDGIITNNLEEEFTDGDTMYFICQNGNLYDVILGKYESSQWKQIDCNCAYKYSNSLCSNMTSNIAAISKEMVNKSQNIDFIVYNTDIELARTSVNIIDSNDPIISENEPSNPYNNQLWLDTSVTPNVLRIYDQSAQKWVVCTDYSGNTIYTSMPSSYSEGDLWILADGEACGDFGPGSMLKATTQSNTFDESHWVDADQSLTSLKENINQYFEFNSQDGLKIGQKDEAFYVQINSTEMGFYDNSASQNKKVVYISNETANIDGLTVEKNLDVACPATFDDEVNFFGFVWKKESDGSLSLSIG